jgi:hypothetical protein
MRLLLIEENLPLWNSIIQLLVDELDDAQASVDISLSVYNLLRNS